MKKLYLQQKDKRLKLTLRTPLVETYQFAFPNRKIATLSIVCIRDVEVPISQGKIKSSQIKIDQIDDELSWLQFLCIRKQLSLIGVAQTIDNTVLYGFDAIKCTSASKKYGIISNQITSLLSSFVSQTVLKPYERQRIINQYKMIMNDLQEHQIIFDQDFSIRHLRVGQQYKPLIRVTPYFQIYPINPNNLCFYPQINDPFEQNIRLMQKFLAQIFQTSQQHQNTSIFTANQLIQIGKILKIASFISDINTKPFTQVQTIHTQNELLKNIEILKDLHKHYRSQGSISQANKMIELIRVVIPKSYQIKDLIELDKYISLQNAAKMQEKKYQTASKTYSQSLKKLYYNPLKIHQTQKSTIFISKRDIKSQICKIKPFNKTSKCQYHFLSAKQAWLNLNFTRSLSHLKKCLQYTSSLKTKSKIHLQLGRIWFHLCNYKLSESQYLTALQLTQRIEGSQSLSILSVLQNLTILYSKMDKIKPASQIHFRCQTIKKRFKYTHLRLMPQLVHSLAIPILFAFGNNSQNTYPKQIKNISKQQAIRIQIQRIPYLQKYWQIIRPYLEKNDKDFSKNTQMSEHLFEFGQLKILYYIIKLIHNYQNSISFNQRQQISLQEAIKTAKNSDIRMYFRLIFLLSYYYQKQNRLIQSINLLKILYSCSLYSLVLLNSFRKRMLELAKKGQLDQQLRIIYSDLDWLNNEGMMQQLYNSALYFQGLNEHMKCIKACKQYIQSIKNYANPQDNLNKNAKIINRANYTQVIMLKSMIQLSLFSDSWPVLKNISQGKIDKQQLCILTCQFCIKASDQDEYWFCIQAFSTLIDSGTLLCLKQQIIKEVWLSVVRSHLNAHIHFGSKQKQLLIIYEKLSKFQQQMKNLIKIIKSQQPLTMNVLWRSNFYEKIGILQIKTNESDLKRTFQSQYYKLCHTFTLQESISIFTLFKQHIQQINEQQKESLIENLMTNIQRISHSKGKISQLTVCLHVYLYQTVSSMQLHKQQILLLLWFSSLSSKLMLSWDQRLWGGRPGRQLLLDRLLFQLFGQSMQSFQLKIDKLWWINSKMKDLLKLWKSYRHIIQLSSPSEQDAITFRILYGSYYSEDEGESALLNEVSDKVGSISDQL